MTEGSKRHRRKLEQAMPRPRPPGEAVSYDEVNSCIRKVPLPSKRIAKDVARRYNRQVRAYRCRYCGAWHLGAK